MHWRKRGHLSTPPKRPAHRCGEQYTATGHHRWVDLVDRRTALVEPTRVLPLVRPLLTVGAEWRSRRNAR